MMNCALEVGEAGFALRNHGTMEDEKMAFDDCEEPHA